MNLKSERKAHIVSLLFLVVFCILAAGSMDTPAPTGTDASPAQFPAQNVSAERLFLDYQRNEVSADSMYKGRTLAVTGTVSSINKDFTDSVYLMLETSNEFMGIHANLRGSEVSKASTLSKGSIVTVVCEGNGMIVGSPMLKDCVIQPYQQQERGVESQQVQGSNLSADRSETPQESTPELAENPKPSAAQASSASPTPENIMRTINAEDSSPQNQSKPYPVDSDLESDVRRALNTSKALKSAVITLVSLHREVTLSGTVVDEPSRELAEDIASHVPGVVAVHNNLTVGGGAKPQ
jgi:osmotically-inducible protein OsmY